MTRIKFGEFKGNTIQNQSGLFYGNNYQTTWKKKTHTSEGFGKIEGSGNSIHANSSIVRKKG